MKNNKNIKEDQFLMASCKIDSIVRDVINMIILSKININYVIFGLRHEENISTLNQIMNNFKNPEEHIIDIFNIATKFSFEEYAKKYIETLNIQGDFIMDSPFNKSEAKQIVTYTCEEQKRKRRNEIIYREPATKYPISECPVCMNSVMKYIWFTCGHNICKDCF